MIPETPQIIKAPFAYNGDTRNIPATTPLGSNQFSFESGFPVLTQTPLNAGGLPPERIDFNSAFNVLSTFIYYMQSGNHFEWNNQLDYNAGAIVLGSDNALYYCIQANGATSPNTVQDPTTSPAYWIKIINNNGKINADNLSVTLGAFALLNKLDVSSDLIINSLNIQNGGTGANTAEQARSNLGLGNVDNTRDVNKPISTATQNALNNKLNSTGGTVNGSLNITGSTTTSSLYIRNLNETVNSNIFQVDNTLQFVDDSQVFNLLANSNEEGENRNPCSLQFVAERNSGEVKKNSVKLYAFSPSPASRSSTIQLTSTAETSDATDNIIYNSIAHRFTGTITENGHRLAPMPVKSSGTGMFYAIRNTNLTLPAGGTWLVYRIICTNERMVADTDVNFWEGGADLRQDNYLIYGFAWRII